MSPYRILVTSSRTWKDVNAVWGAIKQIADEQGSGRIVIVHGMCPSGGDKLADAFGRNYGIAVERHPAQGHPTQNFGPWPGAGPRRNAYVVGLGADVCLAFLDPCTKPRCRKPRPHDSHGTAGTVELCEAAGIPVRPFRSAP